jgi:osmoprotectant transport system permease protein
VTAVHNPVRLSLVVAGATGVALFGFVIVSPNRLLSGQPVALWNGGDWTLPVAAAGIAVALLATAFMKPSRRVHRTASGLAQGLLIFLVLAVGAIARHQVAGDEFARAAPGAAFWIAAFCASMAMVDAMQRSGTTLAARALIAAATLALFAFIAATGLFHSLSLAQEYRNHSDAFAAEIGRHIALVLGSVAPALIIGIPLGIAALRSRRLREPLFAALNLLQTIPSVALFALLIGPLALLAAAVPLLARLGIHGIGAAPAVIALTLYALLPIARYTFAGLGTVDAGVIDSARAMGMTKAQVFRRVELPLALPTLIAGLRIVTVQGIGLAVVAALIGAGGLGSFVFQGIGQGAVDLVLLGAIPTIGLALVADFALLVIADLLRRRMAR